MGICRCNISVVSQVLSLKKLLFLDEKTTANNNYFDGPKVNMLSTRLYLQS